LSYFKKFMFLFLVAASMLRAQVAVAPLQLVRQQFLTATGVPLTGGCVNFFATGTSTPQAIYSDSTGTFQLSNPLTLDAAGEASVWMTNTGYDIVANTGTFGQLCSVSLGTQLWRENNKNPFSIINGGSNYIVASGTVDPSGTPGMLAYRSDFPCLRFFIATWDCIVELTLPQTMTNKTFDISANTLKNPTNTAGHYPRNNGTQYVDGTIQSADVTISVQNNAAFGTLINSLAKFTGTPSTVTYPTLGDTGGVIGVVTSGAGVSGSANIQVFGLVNCVFDAATTAGDYIQISSISAGNCHDSGAGFPNNGAQVLGRVLSTNAAAGTYQIDFFPETKATLSPISAINTTALAANVSSTPISTPTSNGFFRFSCVITETQAATTSSSLPACTPLWTDADSSFAQAVAIVNGNTITTNTIGTMTTYTSSFFAKNGVAISYLTNGYASVGATPMQYAIHIRLEGPF